MEQIYKMGLAGFGMSGEVFHAPYIAADPRFALSMVYERTGGRAQELYPDVITVRSFEALLESDVDVIVLCVPNALHVSMATTALEAGKHVVVEKPLAPTAAEGEALFALAEKQGKLLAVYQNRRYDGGFRAARELVESGTLGEILEWESRFDRWAPELRPRKWKETVQAGSGVLYDLGSHLADEVVCLFGAPEAVWGDLSTQREGGTIDDDFLVRLFYGEARGVKDAAPYAANMRATLRATRIAADAGERPRLVVRGRKGVFTVWGGEDAPQTGHLTLAGSDGRERFELAVPGNAYGMFYDALYESLAHGVPLPVSREQAVVLLKVLEGAGESSRTGNRVELQE